MKGLLFKEFRLCRGEIIVFAIMQTVLSVIQIIISTNRNNPAVASDVTLIGILCCLTMFYSFSMMSVSSFQSDATHAWQNFSAAAPTGPAGQVGSKYIFMLILYLGLFLFNLAVTGICSAIIGEVLTVSMFMELLIMCVMIIITALELPFLFYFGGNTGGQMKAIAFFVIMFIAAVYMLFGNLEIFSHRDPVSAAMAYMTGLTPIIVMVLIMLLSMPVYCLSMMLSVKNYQNGAANIEE